jgi:hypothetical protein
MFADSTGPTCSNRLVRSVSVVWYDRFPTYNLLPIYLLKLAKRNFQDLARRG